MTGRARLGNDSTWRRSRRLPPSQCSVSPPLRGGRTGPVRSTPSNRARRQVNNACAACGSAFSVARSRFRRIASGFHASEPGPQRPMIVSSRHMVLTAWTFHSSGIRRRSNGLRSRAKRCPRFTPGCPARLRANAIRRGSIAGCVPLSHAAALHPRCLKGCSGELSDKPLGKLPERSPLSDRRRDTKRALVVHESAQRRVVVEILACLAQQLDVGRNFSARARDHH